MHKKKQKKHEEDKVKLGQFCKTVMSPSIYRCVQQYMNLHLVRYKNSIQFSTIVQGKIKF
jgi:hypothetical protein